jgi:polysaccharide export outer membrane protein
MAVCGGSKRRVGADERLRRSSDESGAKDGIVSQWRLCMRLRMRFLSDLASSSLLRAGRFAARARSCRLPAAESALRVSGGLLMASFVAALLVIAPGRGQAETRYRLQTGDSVRVAVLGIAGLDITGFVREDGFFLAPLIGDVQAAGVPFDEFRSRVTEALDQHPFRLRAYGGAETITVITADEVLVQIASYRPIFVQGDVRQPGEQVFSPGLTVRQALSRAGGMDGSSMRSFDPFLSVLEFVAQRDALADRLSRLQAQLTSAEAEMDAAPGDLAAEPGAPVGEAAEAPGSVVSSPNVAGVLAAEAAVGAAERQMLTQERRNLDAMTALLEERIRVLADEVAVRKEAEGTDRQNAEELLDLLSRGLTQTVRLTEARRQAVDSLARLRSTEAELLESRRRIAETKRQSERLDDERRISLVRDARRLRAEIASTEIELSAANAKIRYAGRVGRTMLDAQALPYELLIVRGRGAEVEIIEASLDMTLDPGDVVELRFLTGERQTGAP